VARPCARGTPRARALQTGMFDHQSAIGLKVNFGIFENSDQNCEKKVDELGFLR
jgi:hypothetical protein